MKPPALSVGNMESETSGIFKFDWQIPINRILEADYPGNRHHLPKNAAITIALSAAEFYG